MEADIFLPCKGKVYFIDVMRGMVRGIHPLEEQSGLLVHLFLDEWQSGLLYIGEEIIPVQEERSSFEKKELKGSWKVTLQDGRGFWTEALVNINGRDYYPAYVGKVTYETEAVWEKAPDYLYLGAVYERCRVYINGQPAGAMQNTAYCLPISSYAVPGKNKIKIEVWTGTARDAEAPDSVTFGRSMSADVYNVLEPGGILGPVMVCYRTS